MAIDANRRVRRFRGPVLLGALLATVVTVPLLVPGSPGRVQARRYARYRKYNYGAIIARCQGRCGRTNSAIRTCIARDQKAAVRNCKSVYRTDRASCGGDAACKNDARSRFKLCVRSAGSQARYERKGAKGIGYCKRCCRRTRGSGSCQNSFSSSPFYGSVRYRGRLRCVGGGYTGGGGGGGGPRCEKACERAAAVAARQCGRAGRVKGGDPNCLAQAEQERQACLGRCGGGLPPRGSASGAFLPSLSDAIRSRLARLVPWLVDGWSAAPR
jgi:hypothetical protein